MPKAKKVLSRQERWRRAHPWHRLWEGARRRCQDKNSKWYQYYGAKGIEFHLTVEDVKNLWERDDAWKLKKASLDRKDSSLHYTFGNCRVIEFIDNSRMAWDDSFRFLYDAEPEAPRGPEVGVPTVNFE